MEQRRHATSLDPTSPALLRRATSGLAIPAAGAPPLPLCAQGRVAAAETRVDRARGASVSSLVAGARAARALADATSVETRARGAPCLSQRRRRRRFFIGRPRPLEGPLARAPRAARACLAVVVDKTRRVRMRDSRDRSRELRCAGAPPHALALELAGVWTDWICGGADRDQCARLVDFAFAAACSNRAHHAIVETPRARRAASTGPSWRPRGLRAACPAGRVRASADAARGARVVATSRASGRFGAMA